MKSPAYFLAVDELEDLSPAKSAKSVKTAYFQTALGRRNQNREPPDSRGE